MLGGEGGWRSRRLSRSSGDFCSVLVRAGGNFVGKMMIVFLGNEG